MNGERSVALVTSSFLPRVGGVEEHVRHLAIELRDRGYRVSVWTVDQGGEPASIDGITIRYLPTPMPARSAAAATGFLRRAPLAAAAWWRAWRADRPDVLHVQCFGPNGPWASVLARLTRTPLILGAHGETFMDEHRVFDTSALQRRALTSALRHADAVTACSRYAAADLARFGFRPERADVVLNGVDAAEPGGPRPDWLPDRYVLGVGRLVRVKGFDLLLRAFAAAQTDPAVALVIGGDGPERSLLAALADELGIEDRVVLPGRLDRGAVVTAMAGAEVLVVPSRVEAFGITVLEGLRAGVPVIATTRGGTDEIVRDGVDGLIVDPADSPALAAALERLLGDAALRAAIGKAGLDTAADFSWRAVADRVEHVYDRVAPMS